MTCWFTEFTDTVVGALALKHQTGSGTHAMEHDEHLAAACVAKQWSAPFMTQMDN